MDYLDEYDLVHEGAAGYTGDIDLEFDIGPSSPLPYPLGGHDEIDMSDMEHDILVDQLMTDIAEAEETDSTDDADETGGVSFDSWDNDDADNTSSRSSSPPDSTGVSSSPPPPRRHHHDPYNEFGEDGDEAEEEDTDDADDADSVNLVLSSPVAEAAPGPEEDELLSEEDEVLFVDQEDEDEDEEEEENHHPNAPTAGLRERIGQWQQQHLDMVESRRRLTETIREFTGQQQPHNPIQSRFWQDTLGDGTNRQHLPRPPRPRDTDPGQSRRSDRRRNSGQQANLADQLVAVEVEGPRRQTSNRRPRQEAGDRARTEFRTVPVIDLTREPDSPEAPRNNTLSLPRPVASSTSSHNHRRRQMPANNHPPSLNRSNVVSNVVIDLTGDDDPPPARPTRQGPRPARPPGHSAIPPHVQPVDLEEDEGRNATLFGFGMLAGTMRRLMLPVTGAFLTEFTIHNPLGNNRPDFNYQANGYNNGGRAGSSNKPAHVPPPKAREGFTRNTASDSSGNSDEADVFVCPACEEELAYDPGEDGATGTHGKTGPAPKKARTKKDREEHHFWAVKECGHVFCKNCFDTRTKRTATKNHDKSKFRLEPSPSKKVFCAVDGCESEVSRSSAWVGLFL